MAIELDEVNSNIIAGGDDGGGVPTGGDLVLFSSTAVHNTTDFDEATILLNGENGVLLLRNGGQDRIRLVPSSGNVVVGGNEANGDLRLFPSTATDTTDIGQATIRLNSGDGIITAGGNNVDGDLRLFPSTATDNTDRSQATIDLNGRNGVLVLRNIDGQDRISLVPSSGNVVIGGNEANGDLRLFPSTATDNTDIGQATIRLNSGDSIITAGGNNVDDGELRLFPSTATDNTDIGQATIRLESGDGIITAGGNNVDGDLRLFPSTATDNTDRSQATILLNGETGEIAGNIKNFRVPNPAQPETDIVYACIEGPEAAVYVRGTGHLVNGEGSISLPDHFMSVATLESMTVQVTPLSPDSLGLAVVTKRLNGVVVQELHRGTGSYNFDWEVKSVRKGYEDYQVIRPSDEMSLSTLHR